VVSSRFPLFLLVSTVLFAAVAVARGSHKTHTPPPATVLLYHDVVPLGVFAYTLKPEGRSFYLMASSVNPSFNGWRVVGDDTEKQLLDASGTPVRAYPSRLTFRVSASGRYISKLEMPRDMLKADCTVNEYLLKLGFRMVVFRGLESRAVHPRQVRSIGVPPDVPFDERVYLVEFDAQDIPVTDRVVLEVLAPTGERIGKFHLDLY
jgi:hypothetical protein